MLRHQSFYVFLKLQNCRCDDSLIIVTKLSGWFWLTKRIVVMVCSMDGFRFMDIDMLHVHEKHSCSRYVNRLCVTGVVEVWHTHARLFKGEQHLSACDTSVYSTRVQTATSDMFYMTYATLLCSDTYTCLSLSLSLSTPPHPTLPTPPSQLKLLLIIHMIWSIKYLFEVDPYIPTRTPEEDWIAICNHQADSPFNVLPDVWSGDLQVYRKK